MSFAAADSPESFINIKLKKKNPKSETLAWIPTIFLFFDYFKGERERNLIGLGLKFFFFCPDYKKCVSVRSVLQLLLVHLSIKVQETPTSQQFQIKTKTNSEDRGHNSIWHCRSQGITVHVVILTWSHGLKALAKQDEGKLNLFFAISPSNTAQAQQPWLRSLCHCTSWCPWPQKIKTSDTSDMVVSMATSLWGSCAAGSYCSESCPIPSSASLPEEHTGLTQCLPQAEFSCVSCPMLPALLNDPPLIQFLSMTSRVIVTRVLQLPPSFTWSMTWALPTLLTLLSCPCL